MAVYTWDPSFKHANITLSNGNLTATGSGGWTGLASTFSASSGKWYCEITVDNIADHAVIGVVSEDWSVATYPGSSDGPGGGYGYYSNDGNKYHNYPGFPGIEGYGSSWTSDGDVIGIALDMDNDKLWFSKNGVWQASGDPAAGTNYAYGPTTTHKFGASHDSFPGALTPIFIGASPNESGNALTINFGQFPFAYPVPTGFKGPGNVGRAWGEQNPTDGETPSSWYEWHGLGGVDYEWPYLLGGDLLSLDYLIDKIYQHDGLSTTILDSFSSPSTGSGGVAWDGFNVLSTDSTAEKIYQHDGFSTTILNSFSSPSTAPNRVSWDGTNVLSSDTASLKIYQHDGFSTIILDSFSSPSLAPRGIGWDGTNVLSSDTSSEKIYQHDGFSSTILDSFSSPSTNPRGVAWEGTDLLSVDADAEKIYRLDGFSTTILDSFNSPSTGPTGIDIDQTYGKLQEEAGVGPVVDKGSVSPWVWLTANKYGSGSGTPFFFYRAFQRSFAYDDPSNLFSIDSYIINGMIYKHTGFSSTIEDSFSSPSDSPEGIAFDGGDVYSSDDNSDKIYRHDGFSTTILDSFSSPGVTTAGLGWDDTNLLSISYHIYKHDGFSTTILDSFSGPGDFANSIDWDGTNYITNDSGVEKIYKHDGFSTTILDSITAPSLSVGGTIWDGLNIMSTDLNQDIIYKHSGFTTTITNCFSVATGQRRGIALQAPPAVQVTGDPIERPSWRYIQPLVVQI